MSADLGLAAGAPPVLGPLTQEGRNRDRRFFTGMAIAAALTVFIGFAPSYYLSGAFGGRPLTTLVHVHGAIATAWILLFLTQTSLIAAKRTDLHRRLGVAGATPGRAPARGRLPDGRRGRPAGRDASGRAAPDGVPGGPDRHAGGVRDPGGRRPRSTAPERDPQATDAARHHRHPDARHRALAYLGSGACFPIVGTCLFVVACLVYDRLARGRVHPAFLWGGFLVMVALPARFALGQTDAWLAVARWMTE